METEPLPHHPNVRVGETGLSCFLNETRVCGPGCMAFETYVPQHPDYQDKQWAHCMLLVNAHRTGRHLVVIADLVKKSTDDQRRTGQPTPIVPR